MADPHIKSPMDIWDNLSVIIYRSGFVLAALAFAVLPWHAVFAQTGLVIAAALLASSLHIYMKSVRTILQYAAWLGLVFTLLNAVLLGVGFALVTLGGLAFKECFCFKIPLLNYQPVLCGVLWLALCLNWHVVASGLAVVSAVLFAILSVKKALMPRHFDIGDKSKYGY